MNAIGTVAPVTRLPHSNAEVPAGATVLPEADWQQRRRDHETRLAPWLDPHRERMSRGEKHPVYDFLFDYYSLRPSLLARWQPGFGVTLAGQSASEFLRFRGYERSRQGVRLSRALLNPRRLESVRWIASLLEACSRRPPQFACFGLHEWAMVYRTPEIRHSSRPLRFPADRIAEIVESLPICCSHFDAFRFFTQAARPLNRIQPNRENRLGLEQRGCLHANMDLYKWAYKLLPWTPSELLADAFELAREIREIDMRASPYDLSSLGFAPIPVETAVGRADYEARQRDFAERAQPLREKLLSLCNRLISSSKEAILPSANFNSTDRQPKHNSAGPI